MRYFFIFLLFLLGCNKEVERKYKHRDVSEVKTETNCDAARIHINECLNIESTISSECDEIAAETILNMTCQELTEAEEDQKIDGDHWLDRMHCRIGVLHFCKTPICEDIEEIDDCIDAIDLNQCGQCQYYSCLEEKAQCGEEGYLLNFVGKYCERFTQVTYPRLSEFGKVWLEGVRECLIYNMEEEYYEGESCESIKDRGIEDHIECYVGTGICSLPVSDWLSILSTIKPGEFPIMQAVSVGNKCISNFLNRN